MQRPEKIHWSFEDDEGPQQLVTHCKAENCPSIKFADKSRGCLDSVGTFARDYIYSNLLFMNRSTIFEGLKWLARHQKPDDSWSSSDFSGCCGRFGSSGNCSVNPGTDGFDVGNTGLALLSFMAMRIGPFSKGKIFPGFGLEWGDVVKRGLKFLIREQTDAGRIGPDVDKYMYNHAIATLALAESYRLTSLRLLKPPLEKAVKFLQESRNAGAAWRYAYQSGDSDSSVTGWALLALRSAQSADLNVDKIIFVEVTRWLDDLSIEVPLRETDLWDGSDKRSRPLIALLTGYKSKIDAGRVTHRRLTHCLFPTTTAIAAFHRPEVASKAREQIIDTLTAFTPRNWKINDENSWKVVDFCFFSWAGIALFKLTSVGDERWQDWYRALEKALKETQNQTGCLRGSWDPVDRWSGEGGRVYSTAMALLSMEVHYRYPRSLK